MNIKEEGLSGLQNLAIAGALFCFCIGFALVVWNLFAGVMWLVKLPDRLDRIELNQRILNHELRSLGEGTTGTTTVQIGTGYGYIIVP